MFYRLKDLLSRQCIVKRILAHIPTHPQTKHADPIGWGNVFRILENAFSTQKKKNKKKNKTKKIKKQTTTRTTTTKHKNLDIFSKDLCPQCRQGERGETTTIIRYILNFPLPANDRH